MSITDELREWARGFENVWFKPASKEIVVTTGTSMPVDHVNMRLFIEGMLDRIDAEHEAACAEAYSNGVMSVPTAIDESQWVKLPVSEGGDVLHIGELVDEKLPFGGYAAPAPIDTMELSRGAGGYGWMVKLDAKNRALVSPKLLRHHHAPTVEDVLREFAEGLGVPVADSYVAASAAKLRLADDKEE